MAQSLKNGEHLWISAYISSKIERRLGKVSKGDSSLCELAVTE